MSATPAPATPVQQPALASLSRSFDPAAIEARWGPHWLQSGIGRAGLRGTGRADAALPSFSIQLPPPNVTGTLHMGHAFNQTIMDSLARYHRMRGCNTLWLPGMDHAGIATQIVVERQLQAQGIASRHALGSTPEEARKNFVERVWQWKQHSGGHIAAQMQRLGASVDWSREYFTMDEKLCDVVVETFVRLYEQGLIYRGKRLVNWDPQLMSAVSDLEVESEARDGWLWHIAYPLADGSGQIVIATTRPETLPADVAVMVHPEDARYRALIGKTVRLPLCGREIPVIADEYVDQDFGTGAVKVSPGHDHNDWAVAQRHGLPVISIFTLQATLNDAVPQKYRGLERFAARAALVADLQAAGLLVQQQKHRATLPICTRTGQIVEPLLTDQWFVAMNRVGTGDATGKTMAQKGRDAVAGGQVQFFPANWVNTYNQWMDNIQDWCISRQLWWGHQIPAWYDEDGNIYVARSAEEAQRQAPGKTLTRDPDVLDTWYSSALVPFSTMGWPHIDQAALDADCNLYLPSSVLVTGYDIIFFWVARMVMMCTHFTGRVPFRHVYMHGLVLDAQGRKMSKSEGNVLDPVDLIDGIALPALLEKRTQGLRRPETAPQVREATQEEFPQGIPAYGADALRFTFAAQASLGRSIHFDSKRCAGYRNFCNKLWNASRFVLMHCEGHDCAMASDAQVEASAADRWIVSTLQEAEGAVAKGFADYRLDQVASAIYDLVWNEFCDWYLEIAKVQIQHGSAAQQRTTRRTLIRTLEAILRLAHPIIPFVTEELWQKIAPLAGVPTAEHGSISLAPYPQAQPEKIDAPASAAVQRLKQLVAACRTLRGEMNISPAQRLPLLALPESSPEAAFLRQHSAVLQSLAKLSAVQVFDDEAAWRASAQAAPVLPVGGARLALHVAIDAAAEQARLAKEIQRLQGEIAKAQAKLDNPAFSARAPQAIIAQEQQRVQNFAAQQARLQEQAARLGSAPVAHG